MVFKDRGHAKLVIEWDKLLESAPALQEWWMRCQVIL